MNGLLDLYYKEYNENVHWKASYYKLSRKIDVVSKSKIKEKMKEYQNKLDNKSFVLDSEYYGLTSKIDILKELLEE